MSKAVTWLSDVVSDDDSVSEDESQGGRLLKDGEAGPSGENRFAVGDVELKEEGGESWMGKANESFCFANEFSGPDASRIRAGGHSRYSSVNFTIEMSDSDWSWSRGLRKGKVLFFSAQPRSFAL